MKERFKIDYSGYRSGFYGLFYLRPRRFLVPRSWDLIDYSDDKQKMVELYERIKGLPEYLP